MKRLTPQRPAGGSEGGLRARGGEGLLGAVQRRLTLGVKQGRESWEEEEEEEEEEGTFNMKQITFY